MSVQSVALAFLTETYTDSEDESGTEQDLRKESKSSKSPQSLFLENAKVHESPRIAHSTSVSPNVPSGAKSEPNPPATVTPLKNKLLSSIDFAASDDEEETSIFVKHKMFDSQSFSLEESKELEGRESSQQPYRVASVLDEEDDEFGVKIPLEPSGACPPELQEKITSLYEKMERCGMNMNVVIEHRKDFRNPSIYEKLIQYCGINEFGTNYPPDMFDPSKWGKESYYEELARAQDEELQKIDKKRKTRTQVEFMTGTAKRPNPVTTMADQTETQLKKSKKEQVAAISFLGNSTRAAVAFGSLPKKRL